MMSRPTESESIVPGAAPDFLCVGAQKGGTGWLHNQLVVHPDFWMPPRKELHYFDGGGRIPPGILPRDSRDRRFLEKLESLSKQPWLDLEKYGQLFAAKASLLSGDITPAYCMLQDEIIAMIMRQFPKLKVIFLARDPVERAWSQLSMMVRNKVSAPFDITNPEEVTRQLRTPVVLKRSYSSQIVARWRRHVREEQFRIYFFDDLQSRPAELRRRIITFLGGDAAKPSGRLPPEHNPKAAHDRLPLSSEMRAHLARFFAEELRACAVELGGAAQGWPDRYGL